MIGTSSTQAGLMAPLPVSYDSRSIRLHWITALLVVALWCLGETVDWFPKGDARVFARSTHIVLGVTLVFVIGIRIWWRFNGGSRLPAVGTGALRALSIGVHYALYALIVGTVALGIFNAWVRGDNVFNVFTIPGFDPGNKPLREQVGELHSWFANTVFYLAAIHAAAGLAHHFLWKDEVLRRMWPRLRPR